LVLFEGLGPTSRQFKLSHNKGYSLQDALAKALGLEFQLNAIDYSRPHFRNSDLSLGQLERLLAGQDSSGAPSPEMDAPSSAASVEGAGGIQFDQFVSIMEGTGLLGGLARVGVALIAASPRLQASFKVAMIDVLSQMEGELPQMAGLTPELQRVLRVLIEERNQQVVSDLEAALQARPRLRTIAAFYGAGHMTDLEKRLRTRLRYRPAEERWLVAFAVDPKEAGLTNFELEMTRFLVRRQLDALRRPWDKMLPIQQP
jgi:hypothetical protein